MSKIHVLPDENLGGVLREYVEVDRKAKVGDKKLLSDGTILTAVEPYDRGKGKTPGMWFQDTCGNMYPYYNDDNNRLIEPTDIVHIDGVRYRLVDRKAKVGEKVLIYKSDEIPVGTVSVCKNTCDTYYDDDGSIYIENRINDHVDGYVDGMVDKYYVLEPVEPAELVTAEEGDYVLTVDETEASKSVLDLLANLARRVTELEQKLTETNKSQESSETHIFDVIHRIQNEIDGMDDKIEMILDDIVTLDERTQPLVNPFFITAIPTFKYSDLVGKTLKIYGAHDGDYVTVFGYDESTGKSYVLFSGKEGGERR